MSVMPEQAMVKREEGRRICRSVLVRGAFTDDPVRCTVDEGRSRRAKSAFGDLGREDQIDVVVNRQERVERNGAGASRISVDGMG